jgi:hypothetical protein
MTQAILDAPASDGSGNVGDLLKELRSIRDEREKLSERQTALGKREEELKGELIAFHNQHGVERVSDHGLTVWFNDRAMRARTDPEQWGAIFRWAVETGNTHIFHRRVTDSKVAGLVEEGVPLPEGLTLEIFCDVGVRRK